jgi:hypothetical protein
MNLAAFRDAISKFLGESCFACELVDLLCAEQWVLMAKSEALENLGEDREAEQLAERLLHDYATWPS